MVGGGGWVLGGVGRPGLPLCRPEIEIEIEITIIRDRDRDSLIGFERTLRKSYDLKWIP